LYAVTVGKPEIVSFLLEHGADANVRLSTHGERQTNIPSRNGQTVLHAAVTRGNAQIVQLLLSAHADPEALDANAKTPLDYAVLGGNEEIVRLLLARGANVKRTHLPDGRGLLHEACVRGFANLIPLLVESGADPAQRDHFGETPLDLALANKNENAVAALMKLGAQQRQLQEVAEEAMEDATVRGYTEIAQILLEHGLDINKSTARGSTYLCDAALKGQKKMVQLLLDHGAKIAVRNKFGGTALHDAALGGNAEVINILLDRGAEIDARNLEDGATPLMLATSLGQLGAVTVLLKRGANSQLRDSSGHTALDRARETGNAEIIQLLAGTMVHSGPG
jgi:ankyrin repeat protein